MGARLRLKTNVNGADPALRTSDPNMRKIFRAMQKYGLIVADNGSDMYITGTFDTRWNNDILNPAFAMLTASDFEVVELGWKPTAAPAAALASIGASPASVAGGNGATGNVTLTAAAPAGGAVVALSSASSAVAVPARDGRAGRDGGDVRDRHLGRRDDDRDIDRRDVRRRHQDGGVHRERRQRQPHRCCRGSQSSRPPSSAVPTRSGR